MKLRIPNIVVTIPRIAAFVALAGIVVSSLQVQTNSSNSGQIQPQPTATHQAILSTPAPTVSLPVTTTTTTTTAPTTNTGPITTADIPHSAQLAPVIAPSANASVTDLAPINDTTAPGNASGDSSVGGTNGSPASSSSTVPMADSYMSTNWAGYMTAAGNYTAVSGSWTVPTTINKTSSTTADAAWIGIGGVRSSDLIQVGTIDTTTAHGESSSAFYELLPDNARAITHFAITPGDSMSASLSEVTTNIWKITITDVTTGQTYTTTKAYNSSGSTAEWIEEDPSASVGGQPIPLDTFTPVSFTQGNVTGLNTNNTYTTLTIAGSNAQPITLVSLSGQTATPVVTPSVLGSDGESFTVTESPTN